MKHRFLLVFFLAITWHALGQFYDNGQDPFSIRWKQLNTPHFQFIFPSLLDSLAQVYAYNLEQVYSGVNQSLPVNPKKLPVILHSQTILANGEVGWAPARMNLFSVAPQDNYFQPWEQHLVLHESRHNVQLNYLNQKTTKALGVLFGEAAVGAVLGVQVPLWFVEGDAVFYETAASKAGRGRVPDFGMPVKAQIQKKEIYSYGKAMFGSYRDFVPDRYAMGYQLVAYGRSVYGPGLWEQALNEVSKYPFFLRPFSKGLKMTSGLNERQFYKKVYDSLTIEKSGDAINEGVISLVKQIDKKYPVYTNYYNPQPLNEGLLVYKESYDEPGVFVFIDKTGSEQQLLMPGYVFDNTFSYHDSLLVWNEYRSTRYSHKNFINITSYDLRTHKLKYLQQKGKSFYSRIAPNGKEILSAEVDSLMHWYITIREIQQGALLEQYRFDTLQPLQPDWLPNSDGFVFIGVSDKGKSLGVINRNTREITWILKDELLEIQQPKALKSGVLLKGTYGTASNLFFYAYADEKWYLVTEQPYGVGEAFLKSDTLYYAAYTADGYRPVKQPLVLNSVLKPQAFTNDLVETIALQENLVSFSSKNRELYPVKNYSRFAHLFHIHSWAPLAIKAESDQVGIGASVMSQNVLSTSFLTVGYQYYRAENYHEYFVNYQYKGFYPIITTQYSLLDFAYDKPDQNGDLHHISGYQNYLYHNWTFPFYLDRGKWYRRINPAVAYQFIDVHYNPDTTLILNNRKQHKFQASLYMYQLQRTSFRDLAPKWGQSFYAQYETAPFDTAAVSQWTIFGRLYFPGLLKNHSLQFYGGYQQKQEGSFSLSSKLLYPRGYAALPYQELSSFQADYSFPLVYPDLNLLEVLYIKRITLDAFYDFGAYNYQNLWKTQQSIGGTLGFDFHALRFVAPIKFSLTYAHLLSTQKPYFGVNFSVNFSALY